MKNTNKKNQNSDLFKNEAGYLFRLTYIFSRIYFWQFQLEKHYYVNLGQILKCPQDSDDGDNQCDCQGEFWSPPMKCGTLHI